MIRVAGNARGAGLGGLLPALWYLASDDDDEPQPEPVVLGDTLGGGGAGVDDDTPGGTTPNKTGGTTVTVKSGGGGGSGSGAPLDEDEPSLLTYGAIGLGVAALIGVAAYAYKKPRRGKRRRGARR